MTLTSSANDTWHKIAMSMSHNNVSDTQHIITMLMTHGMQEIAMSMAHV